MSCKIASNQPIYQALLEKANSYPEDKVYQKKAYENAAKNLLTHSYDIYQVLDKGKWYQGDGQAIPGVGTNILNFIKDFIKTEVFPSGNEKYAQNAMEEARKLAAQNAPKVEPQPEAKQPEANVCVIAANQPLYNGLIEKANSYPEDKPYQRKAYEDVAEKLLTHPRDVFDAVRRDRWDLAVSLCAGDRIRAFIEDFCSKKPEQQPEPKQPEQQPEPNSEPKQPEPVAESEETRRSSRLASKPKKSYRVEDDADSEDYPDDAELDDDADSEYIPDDEEDDEEDDDTEVMFLFRKAMKKYLKEDLVTTSELKAIEEKFNKWFEENKGNKENRIIYNYGSEQDILSYIVERFISWNVYSITCSTKWFEDDSKKNGNFVCEEIQKYVFIKRFRKPLVKELAKQRILVDDVDNLLNKFQAWYLDSKNNHLTECIYWTVITERLGQITCIRNFLNTFSKKLIV